jgi:hypothetical protein
MQTTLMAFDITTCSVYIFQAETLYKREYHSSWMLNIKTVLIIPSDRKKTPFFSVSGARHTLQKIQSTLP